MQSNSTLQPVRQIAAYELVLEQLRQAIDAGQFRPGDRLPSERDMAEQLDVSRTTLREAVSVLEREGRLSIRRGRGGGFIVQTPPHDPETARLMLLRNQAALRGAFDFRVIVESAAARLAADRRTDQQLSDLRSLLESMSDTLKVCLADDTARHVPEFRAMDSAFHLQIALAARNSQLYDAIVSARRQMWAPVGSLFGRLEPNANDHHDGILAAIEARDALTAGQIMEDHILSTRRTLESWLQR